jgi:benzoate-CoA ligase family protein
VEALALPGSRMTNAVTAFLDDRLADGGGDAIALVTETETATYRELTERASRTGHALRVLGVEIEQRVALLLPDGIAWAATFFGVLRIGAVAVPLNTRLSPRDWAAMLRDSRARVLIADPALLDAARSALTDLPHLKAIAVVGRAAGPPSLDDLLARAPNDLTPEAVSLDDMAFWLYTSGTTGTPKAAVHLHRDLLACRHYGVDVLGAHAGDRVLATSKLFFAYALGNALLIPLFVGAQSYLSAAWPEPDEIASIARRYRPTLFFSVPTFYGRLLRADLPRDTFVSVRLAVSAGERLPAEIYAAFRDRFGVEILDGLGATETIFMVLSNRSGKSRAGFSGLPVPGTDAMLLDANGRVVAPGEEGVLHVRTPSASPCYWNRVDASRRAFVGEWFRTGDVCVRDADGFFRHCGREDDFFKVAGMWVAPGDVEAALLAHPAVAEAGVVGAVAEAGLVKAFAFVVAKNGATAPHLVDELTRFVAEKLPAHQRPRRIEVVDALPRTATGKLQRYVLKQRVGSP